MERNNRAFRMAVFFPVLFLVLAWLIFTADELLGIHLTDYGLRPHNWKGLLGLLTSPLLHGSWEHLISNSFPILVLGSALFFFYKEIFFPLVSWMWLGSGALTWLTGQPHSIHIGASGLIYALAFFLLISGFIRKNRGLLTVSMIVVFLYGYLVWGVFPVEPGVSWEGHLGGLIMGVILAVYFRKSGPENDPKKEWDDSDLDHVPPYWEVSDDESEEKPTELKDGVHPEARSYRIRYRYIPKDKP